MRGALPIPARAILARFQATDELPSWARYIRSSTWTNTREADKAPVATSSSEPLPCLLGQDRKEQMVGPPKPCSAEDVLLQSCPEVSSSACDISSVRGRMWALAQDPQGTHKAQSILAKASDAQLEVLAIELLGHVFEATRCPYANFVLEKCIDSRAPLAARAIAREFIDGSFEAIVQAAKHRSGCRIIKQLLKCCAFSEVNALCDILLHDAKSLCMHRFGNYTMQELLSYGPEHHCSHLMTVLQTEAAAMGADFHAPGVLAVALRRANRDSTKLAHALLQIDGLLGQMGRTPHGQSAVRLVMQVVDSLQGEAARQALCCKAAKHHAVRRK